MTSTDMLPTLLESSKLKDKDKANLRRSLSAFHIQQLVLEAIKTCPVKDNGHFFSQHMPWVDIIEHPQQEALTQCKTLDWDVIKSPIRFKSAMHDHCDKCNKLLIWSLSKDGVDVDSSCDYPDGLIFEFDLNVPSGKMVVANDLREQFPVFGNYDVNTSYGIKKTSDAYATAGLAHAFVGNTCPGVYRINDSNFVIGTESRTGRSPVKRARSVAGVCTDLWWYSIADFDLFSERNKIRPYEGDYEIVKCKPGLYRFKHLYLTVNRDDYESSQIYTEITRISDPIPVENYEDTYNKLNYTAEQIAAAKMKRWPSLFDNMQTVARMIFTDSRDYHPNGFFCSVVDVTDEAVEFPVFDEQYTWAFDDTSALFQCAKAGKRRPYLRDLDCHGFYLNESFTKLAFNICRCIILHGCDVVSSPSEKTAQADRVMAAAKKAMKNLIKMYPDRVPENCKQFIGAK